MTMNYFLDTEFLEGKQRECFPISLFKRESKVTIDLISIGIVCEDDRVQNLNEHFAKSINRIEKLRKLKVSESDKGELARCISLAQTAIEEASMWAVKAATFKKVD